MYKNLKDENVIVELENLVKNCHIEEDLNTTYAIFMKERTNIAKLTVAVIIIVLIIFF